jgi:hypothetical protein
VILAHPPAIIVPAHVPEWRFWLNGEDCGPCLPVDFFAMPKALRLTLRPDEIRAWLPAEYRRLSDDMLGTLLGNLPGLPGVIMGGAGKQAYLYTATGAFPTPPGWNKRDNLLQLVGAGGNGQAVTASALVPGTYYGGTGGSGSAWAALVNRDLVKGASNTVTVGINHTEASWFLDPSILYADPGQDGSGISGGSGHGGTGGQASNSIGDLKSSGGNGGDETGPSATCQGGDGGGAGGPHGDGGSGSTGGLGPGAGDAGYGGPGGNQAPGGINGFDGTQGPSSGWAPWAKSKNAGSGGGGRGGTSLTSGTIPENPNSGGDGGAYGAGSGGASAISGSPGSPGTASQGVFLAINNASA